MRLSSCAGRSGPGHSRQRPEFATRAPMTTDSLGNPVTLREAGSLGAVNDFVEGFIAC